MKFFEWLKKHLTFGKKSYEPSYGSKEEENEENKPVIDDVYVGFKFKF
jgi:hypothetical protein